MSSLKIVCGPILTMEINKEFYGEKNTSFSCLRIQDETLKYLDYMPHLYTSSSFHISLLH